MIAGLLEATSLWMWILVAIALVALFVVIVLFSVVRTVSKPDGTAAPPAGGGETAKPPEAAPAAEFSESTSSSFSQAIRFLRRSVAGRDYKYQIPWYLVIGDPESGKSALISAAGPNLAAHAGLNGAHKALDWHFHDDGILIGVAGRFFKSGTGSKDWDGLLRLLRNNRPRRPVDGVVLTISASDLVGPSALDETQSGARATHYSEMLSRAQRALGFSFPVYVVVTKCDQLTGFGSFCRELPAKSTTDIFGWSNPYHLDASFTAEWVEEAFDSIGGDLQRLQSEIFVERSEIGNPAEVFLFPEEFVQMRSPLHVYLDRLFRETAYREGFRFRGLYFTGDPSQYTASAEPEPVLAAAGGEEFWPPQPVPAPQARVALQARMKPNYAQHLFEKKIFVESGVARPLSRVHLAQSRTVTYIQAAAAALLVILALGTWLGYRHLAIDRDLLRPSLWTMYNRTQSLGRNATPDKTAEGGQADARFGNALLHSLSNAADVNFHSAFVPASWFAKTNDEVTSVMRYAGEHWILSALRDFLDNQKRRLLATRGTAPDEPAPTAADPAAPETEAEAAPVVLSLENTPEFQELERFTTDLRNLQDAINIYESLRRQGQLEDVERIRKLLDYLKVDGVRPSGHLSQALRSASAEPVPVMPEEINMAGTAMKNMITRMFENWFENNSVASDVAQLRADVIELERASGRGALYSDRNLKDLLSLIHQVDNSLGNPNFRWLGQSNLEVAGSLARATVNPLSPADTTVRDFTKQIGEGYLSQLRRNLRGERTGMTGSLVAAEDPLALSAGTKQLELSLENALNLPFMSDNVEGVRDIRVTVNEATRLIWRLDPLQQALRLEDIYSQFVRDGLRGTSPQLSAVLRRVTLEQLRRKVKDLVAQSQTTQSASLTLGGVTEDETLPEVNSFREAAAPLMDISNRFRLLGATEITTPITRIMVAQSYQLLSVLDRRLRDDRLYTAKEGAWRGSGSLAFTAFGVSNSAGLTEFLTTQRDRVKFLQLQAEPLVSFLSKQLTVRNDAENRLITRWQRLIDDFRQYEAKRPDANITVLEDFITTGTDKITPENFCGAVVAESGDVNLDYFLQIRNGLRSAFTERCRDVSAEGVCDSYVALSDLFNQKLAGKFPFARYSGEKSQPEALPEDVTEFYQLFDRNQKRARATLKETSRLGPLAQQALTFLDMMDQLRPLAMPAAEAEKDLPFTLDLIPRFRVNQGNEASANQIIDWTLQVGGQIFRQREPEHPGRWRSGNPIRLAMRWANDSLQLPVPDAAQPRLTVRERNTYFEFTGRWALFALLQSQAAAASETAQSMETQPYILKFKMKTERDPKWASSESDAATGQAMVFLQTRLFAPNSKTALLLPAFPTTAPVVDSLCGRR